MDDLPDFKFWLKQLECPESLLTDNIVNKLNKGVYGLIWEDLVKYIKPCSEVLEVRKNILLYKLKNEPNDPLIQSVRDTVHVRNERKRLDDKIEAAEERWRQQELSCKKKVHMLEKKKADRETFELKKDILKIKHNQMQLQIKDLIKMQAICNDLMPPTVEKVSQATIEECLSLVSNYSNGPDKRHTWDRVAELLTPVKIPVLWNALLEARSHYTDLILSNEEPEEDTSNTIDNIDIGISKLCSEHLEYEFMRFIHNERTKKSQETVLSYIEKIDDIIQNQRPDLSDWFPLALEVRKLEIFQNEMQKEIEKLEEQLPVDSVIVDDFLDQVASQIKTMDTKTADCVQEIKIAFARLKSSGTLITKTRECLANELEKLQLLKTKEENNWLNIDLNNELVVFNDIDVNSLRKIMLKSGSGAYKHLRTCLNQASIVIDIQDKNSNVPNLPIVRVPIYYLIDLYKTFITNVMLSKQINETVFETEDENFLEQFNNCSTTLNYPSSTLQLLTLTDVTCQRTLQNIDEFELIFKNWSNQTVREVVMQVFGDHVACGYTLDEWQKRFNELVYILQKSNINSV